MSLEIGVLPRPRKSPYWKQIKSLLLPLARKQGLSKVMDTGEDCWVVLDGGRLLAAGVVRLTTGGVAEIVYCAGREHRRWATETMRLICDWARAEGATAVRIYGRRGWVRVHDLAMTQDEQGKPVMERVL